MAAFNPCRARVSTRATPNHTHTAFSSITTHTHPNASKRSGQGATHARAAARGGRRAGRARGGRAGSDATSEGGAQGEAHEGAREVGV